jgi:hypothetical protein
MKYMKLLLETEKARLGVETKEYRRSRKFSFRLTTIKEICKKGKPCKGFIEYLRNNSQIVTPLINLIVSFITLLTWIVRFLIILYK